MGKEVFSYRLTKKGEVRIFWEGHGSRHGVMTLGGVRGRKLSDELSASDSDDGVQNTLRRVTGNFKRGNERPKKR